MDLSKYSLASQCHFQILLNIKLHVVCVGVTMTPGAPLFPLNPFIPDGPFFPGVPGKPGSP